MPYGVAKRAGGDTAASNAWIERCVEAVQRDGTPKLRAILICKARWQQRHGGKGKGK